MSWSVYGTALTVDKIADLTPQYELGDEGQEQLELGRDVARRIIDSGAVGEGEKFNITLSGHANPGHQPREGWATDMVSVSVSQTDTRYIGEDN